MLLALTFLFDSLAQAVATPVTSGNWEVIDILKVTESSMWVRPVSLHTNRMLKIFWIVWKSYWDLDQISVVTPQILFKQRNGWETRREERLQASHYIQHSPLIGGNQLWCSHVLTKCLLHAVWQKTGPRRVWPAHWEESPVSTTRPTSATKPPFTRWAAEVR